MGWTYKSNRSRTRLVNTILFCALPLIAYSHGGGLDSNGGHTNSKTKQYHVHRKPAAQQSPSRRSTVTSFRHTQSTSEYFRKANVGVVNYRGSQTKRDVSGSQRKRIIQRDGGRCIICGSTQSLEVDHSRALMNGGDNSASNLATLCHECHVEKTRMDKSLRRKREK
jgi:5-methylcytosine-specific restriction endonuclease McrA